MKEREKTCLNCLHREVMTCPGPCGRSDPFAEHSWWTPKDKPFLIMYQGVGERACFNVDSPDHMHHWVRTKYREHHNLPYMRFYKLVELPYQECIQMMRESHAKCRKEEKARKIREAESRLEMLKLEASEGE